MHQGFLGAVPRGSTAAKHKAKWLRRADPSTEVGPAHYLQREGYHGLCADGIWQDGRVCSAHDQHYQHPGHILVPVQLYSDTRCPCHYAHSRARYTDKHCTFSFLLDDNVIIPLK